MMFLIEILRSYTEIWTIFTSHLSHPPSGKTTWTIIGECALALKEPPPFHALLSTFFSPDLHIIF
jgi:hypothetical protein